MPVCLISEEIVPNLGLLGLGVSVVNMDGEGIEDADIRVTFHSYTMDREFLRTEYTARSTPDAPVRFQDIARGTWTVINKEGYWEHSYRDTWQEGINQETGRRFPETRKDIVIELRKMINPRPLYVHRNYRLHLEKMDYKYGYDLTMGDLVKPHGKGKNADLYFTVSGDLDEETRDADITMVLSFPNEGDGILPVLRTMPGESTLLLGHEAPEEGYQPTFEMRVTGTVSVLPIATVNVPSDEEQLKYEGSWFRTHTELDPESGKVLSARHGKIYFDHKKMFDFGFVFGNPRIQRGWRLSFSYFYAPDHSRSLEFNGETLVPNGELGGVLKQ